MRPMPETLENRSTPGPWRWVLLGALFLGAILRLRLALVDDGIYWADEVYQGLEPAHQLAFGYGLLPWEFIHGARPLALPGMVAALFRAVAFLPGGDDPAAYLLAAKILFCLVSLGTALGCYALARVLGASARAASVGAACCALAGPLIYFAPRVMTESAATLPVILGLALALTPSASPRRCLAGGALVGLALAARLQSGFFGLGLVLILLARRNFRGALAAAGAQAMALVLLGALDRLTWGAWFYSITTYLKFNLVQGGAKLYGTEASLYYLAGAVSSMFWLAPICALLALLAWRRASGVLAICAAYLLLHSMLPHKEYRFILPALPLFFALAAVGLDQLNRLRLLNRLEPDQRRFWRLGGPLLLLGLALLSGLGSGRLSMGDLAHIRFRPLSLSAYNYYGPVNRLMTQAGRRPDLCGLKVHGINLVWTGGYSYLHRKVPLYGMYGPRVAEARYNYVITKLGPAPGRTEVAKDGPYRLFHLDSITACNPDPNFHWRVDPGMKPNLPLPPHTILKGGPT